MKIYFQIHQISKQSNSLLFMHSELSHSVSTMRIQEELLLFIPKTLKNSEKWFLLPLEYQLIYSVIKNKSKISSLILIVQGKSSFIIYI